MFIVVGVKNRTHTTNRISKASISGGQKYPTVNIKHLQNCAVPDVIENQQCSEAKIDTDK